MTTVPVRLFDGGAIPKRATPNAAGYDLPTRLIREIQVRTLRAAARAATYEEDPTGWNYDCDPATVAAFLNELADDIEEENHA